MGKHYAYRHLVKNENDLNVPFYIGIGTKKEKNHHSLKSEYERAFAFGEYSRNKSWRDVYLNSGKRIEVEIFYETDFLSEIEKKEIEFIKLYGRSNLGDGTLVNLCKGGRGRTGLATSQSTKDKIAKALKGIKRNPFTEDHREKMRIAKLGKKQTIEHREKERLSQIERHKKYPVVFSEEARRKIGIGALGNQHAKGHKKKSVYKHSEETKLKMRLARIGRPLSDEHKKNIGNAFRGKKLSPETIDKRKKKVIENRLKKSVALQISNSNGRL